MIKRKNYIDKIKAYIDKPIIKVITGMRRTGKSYFLQQIINELKTQKIKTKDIIYIDKESAEFDFLEDYRDLNQYLKEKLVSKNKKYLFIDEVQEITAWEKSLRSILKNNQADIYITGSNAYLLSSELSTLIAGRFIEFKIYPLSFKEFLEFRKDKINFESTDQEFEKYIRFGSLPGIHCAELEEDISKPLSKAIFDSIILNDIVARHSIRNYSNFERILRFILDNIASTFSAKSISDYLKSQKITVSIETVQNYIKFLEAAYAIYKVNRYDIQGKRHLEISEKYFCSELSFRHNLLGYKSTDINDYLENLVYLELRRNDYEVSIGKLGDLEIDFIAEKEGQKIYIQVTYLMHDQKVEEREYKPLLKVKDNYPKVILSMDKLPVNGKEGIKTKNIIDFLLKPDIVLAKL